MSTDANTAAPSAASGPPSFSEYESAANAADRDRKPLDWTVEKKDSPTPPADSSPAKPVDQVDVQPDSSPDPTKQADSSPAKPEKRTDPRATENRVPELLAERAQLRAETEALRRELAALRSPQPKETPKPADSSPAEVASTLPPELADYDAYLAKYPERSYEQYLRDVTKHETAEGIKAGVARELKARDEAIAKEQERRSFTEAALKRTEQFVARMTEATAADPQFWDGLSADVKALKPLDDIRDPETGQWTERPTPYHWITQRIIESPQAAQFLQHFSDHPEDLHRIAKLTPDDAREALVELRVGWKAKPAAPPTKHVTDAPAPPSSLGRRPTTPTDPIEAGVAAAAAGDPRAYFAAADAQDLAAAGRR